MFEVSVVGGLCTGSLSASACWHHPCPNLTHPPTHPFSCQTCEFVEEEEAHLKEDLLAHPLGIYNELTATAGERVACEE